MADSDYEYDDDGSDDEYIGSKSSLPTRAQSGAAGKKRAQEKPRKLPAWQTNKSLAVTAPTVQEAEDGTIKQSVQEREEDRKRKRLRKDTKPFQRGIIRHVVLVLDLSEAMLEKDMRPNRYITMIKYAQEYVREFFEQNPISQISVLGMHDGICIRSSECIRIIQSDVVPYSQPRHPRGYHCLWLSAVDRPSRHTSNNQSLRKGPNTSQHHWHETNAGDESEYVVATDQELLRELLLATTTPPVVRSESAAAAATPAESSAALMMMGFPSRVVEDVPTMCACHGFLTKSGYTCSRCSAKVCSLPVTCPSCQLTLLLSTHLARSYHHLFPLRNWAEVNWKRAREVGSRECVGCLTTFPLPPQTEPSNEIERNRVANGNDERQVSHGQADDEETAEQKASESARYECRVCSSHFCIDCDIFCHMVLHNCPGCLSQLNPVPDMQENGGQDAANMAGFERLIRFVGEDGKTHFGDLGKERPTREIEGSAVELLNGDIKSGFSKTGKEATVSKLLCPVENTMVLCVGLNYRKHAEECNLAIPSYPTIFTKPPDALAGPLDNVPIHKDCQSQLDYEGELTIVFSRDAKNVSASSAFDYILGYTVGNDVSARNYQLPASVSGGQFGYAKSFDAFAPIGPCIASKEVVGDPQKLRYQTKVNGEVRQSTSTDDMIWTVAQIVEHLTRGTTVRAGTAVMTGTPSGVGLFMEPKGFVGDGDEVEIHVDGIGSLINKMKFE
ncbi:hypothetical protein EJ04DRAFT_533409 [Polyplosphaeria fusca]|uniref:C2H2-type domain-containing protein n=1 Tax=Polyplosphaeria fusca TaxID=682080 RepID=A0A9P4R2D2_9PLEO|nr:hypothetical protein EJ04DRAFT_533409 [Polyplosphaeria fusca]